MTNAIRNYVIIECEVCQRNIASTLTPAGLLEPLPIPTKVWVCQRNRYLRILFAGYQDRKVTICSSAVEFPLPKLTHE